MRHVPEGNSLYDKEISFLLVAFLYIAFLVGGLIRIHRSPMSDTAKAVWVLNLFVIPLIGLLLVFAFVPGTDESGTAT